MLQLENKNYALLWVPLTESVEAETEHTSRNPPTAPLFFQHYAGQSVFRCLTENKTKFQLCSRQDECLKGTH